MNRFEKGDKVKRIGEDWIGVTKGEINIVSSATLDDVILEGKGAYKYDSESFELVVNSSNLTPHTHCDLIKAWADGHNIEFYVRSSESWLPAEHPTWGLNTTYRLEIPEDNNSPNKDKTWPNLGL